MLELDAVCFSFGDEHYQFDLSAQAHSTTAIMGKSGSGKAQARPVTTLFQQHNLFPHLSIHQNLALGIDPTLKLTAEQEQQLTHSLEAVGMSGMEGQVASTLSGGEQQRVALARCLLRKKPILLMDEPFSALDEATRESMQALTRETIENNKLCTIIVTHSPDDAAALNADTYRLKDGKLRAS